MLIGITGLVLACGGGAAPQAKPTVTAQAGPPAQATPGRTGPAQRQARDGSQPPTAAVELTIQQCLQTYCPRPWLDEKVRPVTSEPGIVAASALDELHIHLIYDTSALSEEEAIRIFEAASGLPTVDDK